MYAWANMGHPSRTTDRGWGSNPLELADLIWTSLKFSPYGTHFHAGLFVQASEHAAWIADGQHSGGKVAGDDAARAYDRVLTDGDAGADNNTVA
jgi:hypothetical protein